ncbi:hypothetical protein A2W14_00725 [Candidatus Gottesmanbacteria bacterium RBG_16_37_8]|uniref:isopentenyl-diphosphate Delta-isomerase n=1 Tax=Candidatus Gottesmanbacteria bacterium RBG_16_37_8 TaxID=1798371 RepID=A0A1F5YV78_9BACT|nr:MAG: hypothetical protein A2W14_00725 [Candidatus Gottesmanbacteria bacterium RBG_16_37_8]
MFWKNLSLRKMSEHHDLSGEKKLQLLVLCDRKGHQIGTATRQDCHQGDGKTHLAFMAYVLDRDGKLILGKRGKSKTLWPLFWDASVVSHVLPGETPQISAKRRVKEELAIDVDFTLFGSFFYQVRQNGHSENEFCYLLKGQSETLPQKNPVEISQIKKVSLKDFSKFYNSEKKNFTPWFIIANGRFPLEGLLWQKNIKP